ncbi:hypothetical protein RV134_350169 [Roseovarius sp. EC-HK134]|nr:hypothetical protein RV420_400449 [Roseovarius sp. EC-SD190]VVT28570.1 hypothetical protein RV134_350169 [Roseovarius sp. EC-HK134]
MTDGGLRACAGVSVKSLSQRHTNSHQAIAQEHAQLASMFLGYCRAAPHLPWWGAEGYTFLIIYPFSGPKAKRELM